MFKSNNFFPIISASDSKTLDNLASTKHSIPPSVLMEEAASKIFAKLQNDFDLSKQKVAILVGSGNNGGDGLAVARYFFMADIEIDIFIVNSSHYSEQNLMQQHILQSYGIELRGLPSFIAQHDNYTLIIDCLFGIGYNSQKENDDLKKIINAILLSKAKVVSIDVPSGLSNLTNSTSSFVIADYTYSIGFHKDFFYNIAHRDFCGKITNINISFCYNDISSDIQNKTFIVNLDDIQDYRITNKNDFIHKYQRGTVCAIGGSEGKIGSITFAANSSLSVGAGIVSILTNSECVKSINNNALTIVCDKLDNLQQYLSHYKTFIIGPGLAISDKIRQQLKTNFSKMCNVILDASFFSQFQPEDLSLFSSKPILTPHVGEFCSFFKIDKNELSTNTIQVLREISKKHNVYILLKSSTQFFALPDGTVYIIDHPTAIAAQAGSGDILAGIIGGYLSLGCNQIESVFNATKLFYHNLDKLSDQISYDTFDFIKTLREVIL